MSYNSGAGNSEDIESNDFSKHCESVLENSESAGLAVQQVDTISPDLNINEIPELVLLSIFSYLPLHDLLHRAALVCTYWYDVTCDSSLWHKSKFEVEKNLDDEILPRLLSRSENVKSLELISCPAVTDNGLISVMDQCPTIRKLNISG